LNASDLNNAVEMSVRYLPSTNDYFHGVPTNAALKALSPVTGATVRRLGSMSQAMAALRTTHCHPRRAA